MSYNVKRLTESAVMLAIATVLSIMVGAAASVANVTQSRLRAVEGRGAAIGSHDPRTERVQHPRQFLSDATVADDANCCAAQFPVRRAAKPAGARPGPGAEFGIRLS